MIEQLQTFLEELLAENATPSEEEEESHIVTDVTEFTPQPFTPDLSQDNYFRGTNLQGACCDAMGNCTQQTHDDCINMGGTYQGDGTPCSPNPCAPATGACCINGVCSIKTSASCASAGGIYQGDGTSCSPSPCCPPDGVNLNVSVSGITACGCTTITGTDFKSVDVSASNGSFVLGFVSSGLWRTSTTFDITVNQYPSSDGSCTGTPVLNTYHLNVVVSCTNGFFDARITDGIVYTFRGNGNVAEGVVLSNILSCGGGGDYFGFNGTMTISW